MATGRRRASARCKLISKRRFLRVRGEKVSKEIQADLPRCRPLSGARPTLSSSRARRASGPWRGAGGWHAGVNVRLLRCQVDGLPARWQIVPDGESAHQALPSVRARGPRPIRIEIRHVHMTVGAISTVGHFFALYLMCLTLATGTHRCPTLATMSRLEGSVPPACHALSPVSGERLLGSDGKRQAGVPVRRAGLRPNRRGASRRGYTRGSIAEGVVLVYRGRAPFGHPGRLVGATRHTHCLNGLRGRPTAALQAKAMEGSQRTRRPGRSSPERHVSPGEPRKASEEAVARYLRRRPWRQP